MSETSQAERVSDEELDQMIWKLERDGMTPKLLSLMKELREVRRAKGEPVAWEVNGVFCHSLEEASNYVGTPDPLYASPPPLVLPETLPCPVFLEPGLKFGKGVRTQCVLDALNRRTEYYSELEAMTPEQRAEHDAGIDEFKAMLGGGFRDLSTPVDPQIAEYEEIMDQAIPDNSFTNEELEAMAHGNNPQANAYRELLSFRRNSPVTPDTWIPVSERMPETDGNYWGWWSESKRQGPVWFIKSELQAQFQSSEITHWMPLPAAPQEVKS